MGFFPQNTYLWKKAGLDKDEVTHCGGHISANTRPHQLCWGDWEMGTATPFMQEGWNLLCVWISLHKKMYCTWNFWLYGAWRGSCSVFQGLRKGRGVDVSWGIVGRRTGRVVGGELQGQGRTALEPWGVLVVLTAHQRACGFNTFQAPPKPRG